MELTLNRIIEKAIENDWCWNITCTTCGHREFYESLNQLSNTNRSKLEITQGRKRYGGINSKAIDEILIQIQKLDIVSLSNNAKFPDWLGYLGLILYYTESNHPLYLDLSKHFIKSICEILPNNSSTKQKLLYKYELNEFLKLDDLELVEKEIKAHNK